MFFTGSIFKNTLDNTDIERVVERKTNVLKEKHYFQNFLWWKLELTKLINRQECLHTNLVLVEWQNIKQNKKWKDLIFMHLLESYRKDICLAEPKT